MKKTIVLVDHSFHQKTKSSVFLKEILKEEFLIKEIWDNSWKGEKPVTADEINSFNPDIVIYWQVIGKPSEMKKIKTKNIIWLPMEGESKKQNFKWLNYKKLGLKIICFSKVNFDKSSKVGLDSLYVQYFPKPQNQNLIKDYSGLKIIFWQRRKEINWQTVKEIIADQKVEKIYFRNIPDPFMVNLSIPPKEDIEKYNIIISDKWLSFEELEELFFQYNIFFAPRLYEGIGMAFLEAMSKGLAVVAPNTSTHNEYIINGFNGYLYDFKNPKKIDFSNLKEIGENSFKTSLEGYQKWQNSIGEIINFINKEPEKKFLTKSELLEVSIGNIFLNPFLEFKIILKNLAKKFLLKATKDK